MKHDTFLHYDIIKQFWSEILPFYFQLYTQKECVHTFHSYVFNFLFKDLVNYITFAEISFVVYFPSSEAVLLRA